MTELLYTLDVHLHLSAKKGNIIKLLFVKGIHDECGLFLCMDYWRVDAEGGCNITWNVYQISSTLLSPLTTLYVPRLLSVVRNKQGVLRQSIFTCKLFSLLFKKNVCYNNFSSSKLILKDRQF